MTSLQSSRDDAIRGIQKITGYTFNDQSLVWEAVQAAGFRSQDGNKNLALPGKAVLQVFLIMEGRQRQQSRKTISNVLSTITLNSNLAKKGFELGLRNYIQTNPSQRGLIADGPMADTVEAIIGAIFIDSGRDILVLSEVIPRLGLGWPQ